MGQEPGRIVSRRGTVGGGGKAVLKSWKQEKMGKKVYDNVSYFTRYKGTKRQQPLRNGWEVGVNSKGEGRLRPPCLPNI